MLLVSKLFSKLADSEVMKYQSTSPGAATSRPELRSEGVLAMYILYFLLLRPSIHQSHQLERLLFCIPLINIEFHFLIASLSKSLIRVGRDEYSSIRPADTCYRWLYFIPHT